MRRKGKVLRESRSFLLFTFSFLKRRESKNREENKKSHQTQLSSLHPPPHLFFPFSPSERRRWRREYLAQVLGTMQKATFSPTCAGPFALSGNFCPGGCPFLRCAFFFSFFSPCNDVHNTFCFRLAVRLMLNRAPLVTSAFLGFLAFPSPDAKEIGAAREGQPAE